MTGQTAAATLTVLGVERVAGRGRLIALACVEIELDGIPILLQGVKVTKLPSGGMKCDAPCYRDPDGSWLPAVVLPADLAKGIADEVFAAMASGAL